SRQWRYRARGRTLAYPLIKKSHFSLDKPPNCYIAYAVPWETLSIALSGPVSRGGGNVKRTRPFRMLTLAFLASLAILVATLPTVSAQQIRSEERRVGKEGRSGRGG